VLTCPAPRAGSGGFTLIEGMIAIAILAIVASLGAPSFEALLARFRLRTGADTVTSGLQLARSEALRRNQPVRFTLTANSTSWTVSTLVGGTTIQSYRGNGAPQLSITTNDGQTAVTFLANGLVDDVSPSRLRQIDFRTARAGVEESRILVYGGGQIRLCDPSVTAGTDPRHCG